MNRSRLSLIIIVLILLAGVLWLWSLKKTPAAQRPASMAEVQAPLLASVPPTTSKVVPPPRTTDKEELNQWWVKMNKLDKNFEWKMPIEFYGKVVDDKDQPIEKATIRFQWTDLSREGTSEYNTISDSQGLFRLDGVTGKNLGVQVRKEGYKHYFIGTQFSFEYAAYFEDSFHVPDHSNPVIFRLRKNREAEPLIKREVRFPVSIGVPAAFILNPGDPNAAKVVIELLTNAQLRDKQWSARISVPGGGLQSTLEEFPYEAPESGYKPTVTSEYDTPKPLGVDGGYQGGVFYVQTPKGYGRVEIKMMPGNSYARINSFWNPSGSRNLEFDPAKVIKPTP
ncbi:MAG: carboxypeptidase-like regulatory domain-containing protein [Verrucomicrobia bacterium]|nr:carboxypeptidase-like regulatory domain-containing protein [Verrucomicrobiota bacterium]